MLKSKNTSEKTQMMFTNT